ncbi:SOS response-associated peptidase [Halosimplex litoreum]|uniref:SOS response-associated peptidase n=1 Tax=Halosimplex litoreum TaxID=1198301 RepID=A0A7T3FX76_9EURY|nr:SOS response-associated peptidase [Halosimplex litoreum]QPV62212.1 SOS response-associated peptidase [Halosimplex litoreum]
MCGRYSLFAPPADVEERFDATFDDEFEPRYNAAPSQSLPVVTGDEPETIQRMEWGLVPSWADDRSDFEFINARAETVREKRSFADAYESRRCLVPADGFYEWTDLGGSSGKQPYRVTVGDDELFAMAGLWERWTPPQTQTGLGDFGGGSEPDSDPDPVETFTVITTEPNETVAELHHRMAVILDPAEEEQWLTGEPDAVESLLDPYSADAMRTYPVSTAVNNPANDTPEVLEEAEVGG